MGLQLIIDEERCIQCSACIQDCPYSIIELKGKYPTVNVDKEKKCIKCQHCLAVCPTGALSVFGLNPANSLSLKGGFPEPEKLDLMIRGRRSIRRFSSTPIAAEIIDNLLETTSHAPTGVNRRQCLFTVVEDPQMMHAIAVDTITAIRRKTKARELPQGMEFFGGIPKAWDTGKDVLFRKAPHMLIVSAPDLARSQNPTDGIIALSYFELMANSMGIGTLWNGLVKWAFTVILPEMKEKLGIPADHAIGYVMLFGKPAVKYFRTVQRNDVNSQRANYPVE